MKAIPFVLAGALTACAAAAPPDRHVEVLSSGGAAFANYRTFGIGPAREPAPPFQLSERALEVEERIRPLVVAELSRKGYTEQVGQARPDLLLKFAVGYATRAPAVHQGDPGSSSGGMTGEMVVDAFDGASGVQVWRGTAQSEVDPDKVDGQLLQYAVEHLFATFPGRPTVASAHAP